MNKNTVVKFRVYIGDYTTQLRGDYNQYHEIRIPVTIGQPVFHGKYIRFSFVAQLIVGMVCESLEV